MPNGIPSELLQDVQNNQVTTKRNYGFQPGKSGNPGGRPKKKPITEIFERILADTGNVKEVERAIMATLKSAGMAKVLLLDKITDRLEGKVSDHLDIDVRVGISEQVERFRQRRIKDVGPERIIEAYVQPEDARTAPIIVAEPVPDVPVKRKRGRPRKYPLPPTA